MSEYLGRSVEQDPLKDKNVPMYFRLIEDAMKLVPVDTKGALASGDPREVLDARLKSLVETYRRNPTDVQPLVIRYINNLDEIIQSSKIDGLAVATYYHLNQPGNDELSTFHEVGITLGISEQDLLGIHKKTGGITRIRISRAISKGMRKIGSRIYRDIDEFLPDI